MKAAEYGTNIRDEPSAEGSHECHVCGRRWGAQWMLVRHLLVHNGKKLHVCDEAGCQKRFSQRSALLMHSSTVHCQEKLLVCPKEGCGRSFKVERDVRNHVKNFHDSVNVQKRELLLRDRVKFLTTELAVHQECLSELRKLLRRHALRIPAEYSLAAIRRRSGNVCERKRRRTQ